jgi:hypothetical protein
LVRWHGAYPRTFPPAPRKEEKDYAGISFMAKFHHLPFIEDNALIIKDSINGNEDL